MKLGVTQKILAGYFLGFILLLAFAALTLFNGKRIEATTMSLAEEKIPGLINASQFKNGMQVQVNHLFELYATTDHAIFAGRHRQDIDAMQKQLAALQNLPEFKPYAESLATLNAKQATLTDQFVTIMRQPSVDWDAARTVLADFSQGANAIGESLDKLDQSIRDETLARAEASQRLTEQLMNGGLILSALVFLGVLAVSYFTNQQVAVPLRAVSGALSDIVSRKDLTHRVKQFSKDEVGDIALAANKLLDEFQRIARTLDGTAQEVNQTMSNLTEVTEGTRTSMTERNFKLRTATQQFLHDIQIAVKNNQQFTEVDVNLHRAQMQFIQTHTGEIEEGTQAAERNIKALQSATVKLQKLAQHMQSQIRLLKF